MLFSIELELEAALHQQVASAKDGYFVHILCPSVLSAPLRQALYSSTKGWACLEHEDGDVLIFCRKCWSAARWAFSCVVNGG